MVLVLIKNNNKNMEINLVSDTITKPSREMLVHMLNAVVGDDVYKQDPTVIELEGRTAAMFGMEAGLFFPSGTILKGQLTTWMGSLK